MRASKQAKVQRRIWQWKFVVVLALLLLLTVAFTVVNRQTLTVPTALTMSGSISSSTAGGGNFGTWTKDAYGLPAYDLTMDNSILPTSPTQEGGASEIEHQIGNDHIIADASANGYVSLWSQDRLYEWVNHYDSASEHYSGGFGYLNFNNKLVSDLYAGLANDPAMSRTFGVGYYDKQLSSGAININHRIYAPFGNDPVLLDDVVITNNSSTSLNATWYEYWDVNPLYVTNNIYRGFSSPVFNPKDRTLSVVQDPLDGDFKPLSIFASSLNSPLSGFETSAKAFFGSGTVTQPAEVLSNKVTNSISPPVANGQVGSTLFVFRSPFHLAPGASTTLRYAYGSADPDAVDTLVAHFASSSGNFKASEQAWNAWLPRVEIRKSDAWLGRELAWDAYMLRSGTTYEECSGEHIISQGGYYQYASGGMQVAYRDPLQFALPMIYSDPNLASQIILYSAKEQSPTGVTPYETKSLCQQADVGVSDDNDVWLLLAAAEYGLATKNFSLFRQQVPYSNGTTATLWEHLQVAFKHQESLKGPHGDYLSGASGDWSDFSTYFLHMTESTLVTAQLATVYPLMAELAVALGDTKFASLLNTSAALDKVAVTKAWTKAGWYIRGWDKNGQIGTGAIFEEPQPWAMLAGIPTIEQSKELLSNIRRFLTGIGAPSYLNGPSKIGSSQSPARNDPKVTERTNTTVGVGTNNAVYVGGTWYSLNGTLVWGMANLDPQVPGAAVDAFDEYLRNTLFAHATAFPNNWDGIISVDDACNSFYSTSPGSCGIGLTNTYQGQIMHQPAWSLFDTIALSGIVPTASGYDITPHWPAQNFSVEFPDIGLARSPNSLKGYFLLSANPNRQSSASSNHLSLKLNVSIPSGISLSNLHIWNGKHLIPFNKFGDKVSFVLTMTSTERVNWEITW